MEDVLVVTDPGLKKWLDANWTHWLIAYAVIVITLSLVVQVVATILIGSD